MLEFGQVRFQISSYFGNKQTGRSLFATSVGLGWGRGIAGVQTHAGVQTEGVAVEMPLRALSVQACQRGRRVAALGSPPSRPDPAQLPPT